MILSQFYASIYEFYDGQLKQHICNSFTLLISYGKIWFSSFRLHFDGQNIQGRSHNVVKVIFHTIRNCSKRKEFAPRGSK